ncbi:P-loop containing nucleoside triphosphate hydrolase protein [Hypoxylon sp. FL0543]|nr:P-loop containing nucleoside triphosphate hydrolase protein [Hypoxylon sp. FL0543]
MARTGDGVDTSSKKLHPFFTTKNASKDELSNPVTPVTPDPSCSPNSASNSDSSPPTDSRKRKRPQVDSAQDVSVLALDSKPQKVLKLNRATGTIGSPPRIQSNLKKPTTRRGRKPKTLLVSIRYAQDDDAVRLRIGHRINEILAGNQESVPKDVPSALPNTPPSSRGTDESSRKATHPFFQGKAKATTSEQKQKPERRVFFTSASGSSRPTKPAISKFNLPTPGVKSHILRVPGARYPAWPSKENAHVRGDASDSLSLSDSRKSEYLPSKRKAKGQQVQVTESESVIHQTASTLKIERLKEELQACNSDEFQPPPPVLRIPDRHFESGKRLQARVFSELKTLRRHGDTQKTHPAITRAYSSIEKGVSAFDRATCETSAWAQKYAPSSAEQVLQSGREAELLRDWLENLKVHTVDTGAADSGAKPKAAAPAKSKGKRRKKMDGFVVSSDDETDELGEISDAEDDWSQSRGQTNTKKTVVRSRPTHRGSRDGGRFANAVVLSGPHGCGKTAAVYAIAKELDFEIFEINPGSRRNGKDVLEKVGDMTRNHLVQHRHKENILQEGDALEDEVDREVRSGKQGMMTAFFRPKSSAGPKPTKKPPAEPPSSSGKEAKKPAKTQKQSLILLEEVDVLYEEDKQFWATIISMISQSKRPFVMTCNDEALVPLESLDLHGIFRFSSPPKDLAVDLLLLIAANEGHALRRRAVETLYDSRKHDLRASMTELNYWCQIGVGDVRGGFNWFYPRWPKGRDVDNEGNTIRVVSQDTYQAGMGWLNRDAAVGSSSCRPAEEELYQQACQDWSVDTYETRPGDDFSSWATRASEQCSSAKERLKLLELLDAYTSFMSDADIGSADFSAMPNQVPLDASTPSLTSKAKEDFIIGRPVLEVSPTVQYDTTRFDLTTSLKNLSRGQLEDGQSIDGAPAVFKLLDEAEVTAQLESRLSESFSVEPAVARPDYSLAFDPIAVSEKTMAATYLDPSVFDGTMRTISLDVAPYVRSIVAYDQRLQQERLSRGSLLSEGGQPGRKRMRTTRSAYSALEGGSRSRTRRERYFSADINPHMVMRTGGKGWDAVAASFTTKQNIMTSEGEIVGIEPKGPESSMQ